MPTVFVLAASKEELKKFGTDVEALKLAALDWADDNLAMDEVPEVIKQVVAVFTAVNKAAPSASGDDTKKN